ncbi:MAG TPA: hypothetical protein VFF05_06210, partial [Rudaea sp.]|nr:hypothetical protein [Rudaea sp.]
MLWDNARSPERAVPLAMIVHDGLTALSPFRLERLNRDLAVAAPQSRVSAAWWVYFVQAEAN